MHAFVMIGSDGNNALFYISIVSAVLIFLTAYYFIRKSLLPSEDFNNKMLSTMTHEDKENSLLYCISFFQDAYDAGEMPDRCMFQEFRLRAAVVFTFCKKVKTAAYIFMKLKDYYNKDTPLPDFTDRYKDRLAEDCRGINDRMSAFFLYGIDEFTKLLE